MRNYGSHSRALMKNIPKKATEEDIGPMWSVQTKASKEDAN